MKPGTVRLGEIRTTVDEDGRCDFVISDDGSRRLHSFPTEFQWVAV